MKYLLESSHSHIKNLPKPGLYVANYGSNGLQLVSVSYSQMTMEGIKLTGDVNFPAGEKSFIIDTSENPAVVEMQHAESGLLIYGILDFFGYYLICCKVPFARL